jgi:hypothetical protein
LTNLFAVQIKHQMQFLLFGDKHAVRSLVRCFNLIEYPQVQSNALRFYIEVAHNDVGNHFRLTKGLVDGLFAVICAELTHHAAKSILCEIFVDETAIITMGARDSWGIKEVSSLVHMRVRASHALGASLTGDEIEPEPQLVDLASRTRLPGSEVDGSLMHVRKTAMSAMAALLPDTSASRQREYVEQLALLLTIEEDVAIKEALLNSLAALAQDSRTSQVVAEFCSVHALIELASQTTSTMLLSSLAKRILCRLVTDDSRCANELLSLQFGTSLILDIARRSDELRLEAARALAVLLVNLAHF